MLLNHFKQRSSRASQHDATFQQDSTFPALKESTMENIPNPAIDDGKVTYTQDRKHNKLITTLLSSKRAMAATFNNNNPTNTQSPTALQENNPFKKRVEQYFKQCDNISLQQKLRTLAPTTINNLTMTSNRNNPITNKPFLVAPFERNSQIEKRFTPMESQRASVNLKNYGQQNRMASADGRRNSMLSTEGDNTQAMESTLVSSNVTKMVIRAPRAKSNETAVDRMDKKLASLRIPSYTSIDKESVEGTTHTEKTKRKGESVKHNRRTAAGEQTRTRRRDSLDSDSCLNFRTASTLRNRYMQTTEEDITQKEGSLMRYFRAKVVKQRPATTHKAVQRSSIKVEEDVATQQVPQSPPRAKTAAPRRSRDITLVNQEEDNEKGIGSGDTSFEGFSVLDSFNISDTLQVSRPTTAIVRNNNHVEMRRNSAGTGNTTLFSSLMNKDSVDMVLLPEEENQLLNYSEDKEEIMSSSIGFRHETFGEKKKNIMTGNAKKNHDFLIQIKESRRYQNHTLEYSSAQESAKGSVTSKREPITERLTEENEPNFPESSKKRVIKPFASKDNLKDLVEYAKQRGQELGVEESQDKSSRLTAKFNQALAMADFVQLKGGVVQRALRSSVDSAIPTVFRKDVREMRETQENIENLTGKIQTFRDTKEQFYEQHKKKVEQAKIASVQRLTNTELYILHEEFLSEEEKHDINVEKIDIFLKRLKFFSQLTEDVRANFYKNAKYIHHKIGEYIFHQGDEGDLMYVILKGSVNVKILKKMKDGQSQMINVNSLYDGAHFGELAIMGIKPKPQEQKTETEKEKSPSPEKQSPVQKRLIEIDKMISARTASPTKTPTGASAPKAKRSASIQCSEETELLAINREKFQEILFSVMHKDLDAKVRVLHQIPFFKNEDSFNLMPIANLLQIKNYKLGQRIIKAGDPLNNFYLVAQGRCKVVSEITDGYALNVEIYKDRLKPFKFKPGKKTQQAGDPQATDGFRRTRDSSNPMRRTFDNEPFMKQVERGASAGKPDKFTKHVFYRELIPGSCFGFRPLLKTDEESRYNSNRDNYAKLSVVAETPNVEIYVLPRASVMLIPERIKNLLLDGIASMSDFDDCDLDKPIQEHQAWRKYQLSVINNALNKSEHPNLRRFRDSYKAK